MNDILVFLLLTLNKFHTFSSVPIAVFEQIDVSWDCTDVVIISKCHIKHKVHS